MQLVKDALAHYTFVSASCIALFAFFLVFAGTLLWVFRKGSDEIYQYTSDIPLKDSVEEGTGYEQK